MLKTLGILIILSTSFSYGYAKKYHFLCRVKSLEQMIFAIQIMKRELTFNCLKTCLILEVLSKKIAFPVNKIFSKIHLQSNIDDNLSIEHKWTKCFKDCQDFAYFSTDDIEIIVNMSSILGKFDVSEQVDALNYFESLLLQNLAEAKIRCNNDGNIIRAVSISIGMIIAIILI